MNVTERARAVLDTHAKMTPRPLIAVEHREASGTPEEPGEDVVWWEVKPVTANEDAEAIAQFATLEECDEPNARGFVELHELTPDLARAYLVLRKVAMDLLMELPDTPTRAKLAAVLGAQSSAQPGAQS